jgi:hypothetical protein
MYALPNFYVRPSVTALLEGVDQLTVNVRTLTSCVGCCMRTCCVMW